GDDAALIAIQQRREGLHEIASHRATDAAITQEDGLLIEALDQMVVESHLAKLVDQYGGVMHPRAGQEMSQQGRLPTPEKPRNDGDRSCGGTAHTPASGAAWGGLSRARSSGSSGSSGRPASCWAVGQRAPRSWTMAVLPLRSLSR